MHLRATNECLEVNQQRIFKKQNKHLLGNGRIMSVSTFQIIIFFPPRDLEVVLTSLNVPSPTEELNSVSPKYCISPTLNFSGCLLIYYFDFIFAVPINSVDLYLLSMSFKNHLQVVLPKENWSPKPKHSHQSKTSASLQKSLKTEDNSYSREESRRISKGVSL